MTGTLNRITINPGVCGGRPCIRGLRIRVKDILDMLAGGATREEILADYPVSGRPRYHGRARICSARNRS